MRTLTAILLLIAVGFLYSCASSPEKPPKWEAEENGIVLNLKAANKLNLERGKSYSLYLVVYQLTDPNAFNQYAEDRNGLSELLESKIFDPGVVAVKNFVVYPGSDVTYRIDRAEDAKYVGLVAGYRTMTKKRMVRLFEIPVRTETEGYIKRKKKKVPAILEAELKLGPDRIEEVIMPGEDKEEEQEEEEEFLQYWNQD